MSLREASTEAFATLPGRCGWCGVKLAAWQPKHCRVCAYYFRWNLPSPPCSKGSRWDEKPDTFKGWLAGKRMG